MPADGSTTIGDLIARVLKEMGKLQNFSVSVEGSRTSLNLDVNTSVLVGQRVIVKYLPGPCERVGVGGGKRIGKMHPLCIMQGTSRTYSQSPKLVSIP